MPRRVLQGIVVRDSCDKTIVVEVKRRVKHPLYRKFLTHSRKFMAQDSANAYKIGDSVTIRECPPKSKRKRWEVYAPS